MSESRLVVESDFEMVDKMGNGTVATLDTSMVSYSAGESEKRLGLCRAEN